MGVVVLVVGVVQVEGVVVMDPVQAIQNYPHCCRKVIYDP